MDCYCSSSLLTFLSIALQMQSDCFDTYFGYISSSLRSLFSAIFLHITQRPFDVTYSLSAFPFQYQNKKTRIAVLVTRTQINCLTFDQIFQPVDPILQLNLDMDSGYTPNMKRFIRKVSHFRCPNITN